MSTPQSRFGMSLLIQKPCTETAQFTKGFRTEQWGKKTSTTTKDLFYFFLGFKKQFFWCQMWEALSRVFLTLTKHWISVGSHVALKAL